MRHTRLFTRKQATYQEYTLRRDDACNCHWKTQIFIKIHTESSLSNDSHM
jgi:hypothetical protein